MDAKRVSICGGVVLVAGLAIAAWRFWPEEAAEPPPPPPPAEQTVTDVAKYLASEEFAGLDPEKKQKYFDKIVERFEKENTWPGAARELSEEERKRFRKNAGPLFRKMMEKRIDKYFELPEKERTAYLDKMIDGFQAMRKARGKRRAERKAAGESGGAPSSGSSGSSGGSGGSPHGRGGLSLKRISEMFQKTSPERRAKLIQFMLDMRKRAQERGVTVRGHGSGKGPPPPEK